MSVQTRLHYRLHHQYHTTPQVYGFVWQEGTTKVWLWMCFPNVSLAILGRPLTWRWVALEVCLPAASHPGESDGFGVPLWVVVNCVVCLPIFRVYMFSRWRTPGHRTCLLQNHITAAWFLTYMQYWSTLCMPLHVEYFPRPNCGIVTHGRCKICGKPGRGGKN